MMAAKEPKEKLSSETDDYLGKIIEVFEKVLLNNLRVAHLLCMIDIEEVREKASEIHTLENNGDHHGAARLLLEAIRKGDQPGKWRMFVDALQAVGNTESLHVILLQEGKLLEQDEKTGGQNEWLSNYVNQKLIYLVRDDISQRLNLGRLLTKLWHEKLILKSDMEHLDALLQQGKKWEANTTFLLILHRQKKEWYKDFMKILYKDEHHRQLMKWVDEEEYNKLEDIYHYDAGNTEDADMESLQADFSEDSAATARNDRSNLASLTRKDVGDKSVPHSASARSAPKHKPQHSGDEGSPRAGLSATGSCACACCERLMEVATASKVELSDLKVEVASLKSELLEMKTLLHQVLNMNRAGT